MAGFADIRRDLLDYSWLTHVAETLHLFPGMGWGQPTSIGHYIDLVSAILGCALLLLGFLGRAFTRPQ
jgi:hypothetical protein